MDSQNTEKENRAPGFIRLVEPTDILRFANSGKGEINNHFFAPEKLIPQLGQVRIWGSKFNSEFIVKDDSVIYIDNGQIKTGKGKDLEPALKDMFEILTEVRSKVPPNFKCRLKLGSLLDLESDLKASEDEDEQNPLDKYYSQSYNWKDKDGNVVRFFGPADPSFLSQLEFSFYTNLPPHLPPQG